MRITTEDRKVSGTARKLVWFVGLWLGGVITVGGVAAVLRFVLHAH